MVLARKGVALGEKMTKTALLAAIVAVAAASPGWAAEKAKSHCTPARSAEAEQAIRYITDVMVASTACQNTIYAEFRLRNRDAIIGYQKAMAAQMRGNAAFDRWNTALANQAAQRQATLPTAQFCQQADAMLKQASTFDANAFRAYAAAQAKAAAASTACK
jgi:hypothetical protein